MEPPETRAPNTEALLRRVIQTDPSYLEAYAALAQLYLIQKRRPEALRELEALAKRDPRPVGTYTMIGVIQQSEGNTKEATDYFNRALQLDPEAPVAANNLAWLYASTDDQLDRALELALRAKARLPDRPEINDTIGWVYYRRGMATDAIQYFLKSVEKDETNPVYHYHLGLAYLKNGDSARGRLALERALKLRPNFDGADVARETLQRIPG
jgi:tetratricopeptide (TPR) repeat protein